ncbi:C-type lectin domain family 2 member D-like isoform X2 [Ahaetulla prasina]|uniref:C-type lectin domain family 2 member D-like isoform X2 n=1 Tax=Ahaetulla prasina TaxID=499056 RepID=UPI002647388F|nr:C-type lectin domain family 2 member D-like isoform X2 [Ahaetulla prasina]
MSGGITGEGDSGCCDNLTPEVTTESSARRSAEQKRARNADLVHKYISKKKIIIAAVILIIVLIIIIISLAVKQTKTCPSCHSLASQSVACPDSWIGYKEKCFYASKEEMNWSLSLTTCSSFNASLAVIDSQTELEFWVGIFKRFDYWFGLSRENKIWKWSNGTEFKNQFPVRGEGFCAYINEKGASSTICSMEKLFLCSRPENCRKPG